MGRSQSFEHVEGNLVGCRVDVLYGEEETGQMLGVGHHVVLEELVESEHVVAFDESVDEQLVEVEVDRLLVELQRVDVLYHDGDGERAGGVGRVGAAVALEYRAEDVRVDVVLLYDIHRVDGERRVCQGHHLKVTFPVLVVSVNLRDGAI